MNALGGAVPGLADACPVCLPGDVPAAFPQPAGDPAVRVYACGYCGARWRTRRDGDGWPVERVLEPVTPEEADAA